MFVFPWQVKIRRKLKSPDKDNGLTSPTIPSITFDSVFDSGKELSSDVYSTVGTAGTKKWDKLYSMLISDAVCWLSVHSNQWQELSLLQKTSCAAVNTKQG